MRNNPQNQPPNIKGEYAILKRWHLHSSVRHTNPSRADIEKVSGDYAALYRCKDSSPPGRPILIHIETFQIEDGVPSEVEVEATVRQLNINKAVCHTHLRSKNIQGWLPEEYLIKESIPPNLI